MRLLIAAAILALALPSAADSFDDASLAKAAEGKVSLKTPVAKPMDAAKKRLRKSLRATAVEQPDDAAARAAVKDIYPLYVAVRKELILTARTGLAQDHPGLEPLVDLLEEMDRDVESVGKARSIHLTQAVVNMRKSLYTCVRAAEPGMSRKDAETKAGITSDHGDPLAEVARGDAKDPDARIFALRKLHLDGKKKS